jgi:hypothetical protein
VRQFFQEHPFPRTERNQKQALETINGCIALRDSTGIRSRASVLEKTPPTLLWNEGKAPSRHASPDTANLAKEITARWGRVVSRRCGGTVPRQHVGLIEGESWRGEANGRCIWDEAGEFFLSATRASAISIMRASRTGPGHAPQGSSWHPASL